MTNNKLKSHVICQKVTSALENQPSKHGKDKRETREGAGITRLHQEGSDASLTRAVLPLPWRAELPLRAASFSQHSLEAVLHRLDPHRPSQYTGLHPAFPESARVGFDSLPSFTPPWIQRAVPEARPPQHLPNPATLLLCHWLHHWSQPWPVTCVTAAASLTPSYLHSCRATDPYPLSDQSDFS